MGTACTSPRAQCALGEVVQLGGAVCYPSQGLSHVGRPSILAQYEDRGPYLFAAKALVPCMLQQGLIGTGAPISQPRAPCTYPSRSLQSQSIPAIRVYATAALAICLYLSLFIIITYYYILLRLYLFLNHLLALVCTDSADQINQGSFKLASGNLVGLPILMPLIDTD